MRWNGWESWRQRPPLDVPTLATVFRSIDGKMSRQWRRPPLVFTARVVALNDRNKEVKDRKAKRSGPTTSVTAHQRQHGRSLMVQKEFSNHRRAGSRPMQACILEGNFQEM